MWSLGELTLGGDAGWRLGGEFEVQGFDEHLEFLFWLSVAREHDGAPVVGGHPQGVGRP